MTVCMTAFAKTKTRILLILAVALGLIVWTGCGHYSCHDGFGSTNCGNGGGSGGGGGLGGGGGGGGGGTSSASAYVYAVDQGGTIDGYALSISKNTLGTISNYTPPTIPSSDPGVGMVVAQKQFIYAMFELTDTLYGWSFDANTGALTLLTGFPFPLHLNAPLVGYNEYNLATNPAGTLLFIGDTGANEIMVFQISSTGQLTAASGSPYTVSYDPWNVTTDGQGKYLYVCQGVSGHISTGIAAYAINNSTGELTAVPGSPFTAAGFNMWELQGESSGQYMIGTTGNTKSISQADDDHLYVFSITQSGNNAGALTAVSSSPFATTYSPFTIAAQPASSGGELVYSFSINDAGTAYNPIEGFSLNTTTGNLTTLTNSPFSNIATGHWGQFDQNGGTLMVYSSVITGGGTVTQLGPLEVGTNGDLTQPISSETLVTPGYWVVTDP